ncbi:ankyrin repeat domain-containing protein [Cardinium endosymbiont of Bemisia tabaci]|uniref:ankyrin repeat domain-containing protein n=1 Tax=Cardinium endosymbiont of Bemisia tabaci TaxID=672794 RepID=UPI000442D2B3|nr:ankyrin repeat domain-containing protein [Cardinium endosymbiont of Bemisia tabaci]CDG50175.1 Ankyrin repeats-containing protein [Cardinium endosymbiont cBtQ1 of Bemisia tabaci]
MKRSYYSFSLLALIATNCLGNKKNTTSTKPSRSNQNKSAPVKRKKESGINKESKLGCTAVNTSNLESKKDTKDTKDTKDVKDIKNINEIDKMGDTLLSIAVRRDDVEQVKKLLQQGANPNINNQDYKDDMLYTAVCHQNKDMVSLLLSHGAEVVFDENGKSSVIREAAGEGAIGQEILDIIFCHFADIGKKDSVGLLPIHWACRDGYINVVKHILEKDRSLVNDTNNLYGFTPLHWAARRGFKEIVEVLVAI